MQRGSSRAGGLLDVITALFVLLTVGVIAYVMLLIADPHTPLNPLPPPTVISLLVLATDAPTSTPTATFTPLPATYTSTATNTPTATSTPTPAPSPTITPTPVFRVPTKPGSTTVSSAPITKASYYTASTTYRANKNTSGCQWTSVAGQVLDKAGNPVPGIAVHVGGSSGTIDEVHYAGETPDFGPSGFEAFLGTAPRVDSYTVQLLSATGAPLSDPIAVQTKTGCTQNVAFVTFTQSK